MQQPSLVPPPPPPTDRAARAELGLHGSEGSSCGGGPAAQEYSQGADSGADSSCDSSEDGSSDGSGEKERPAAVLHPAPPGSGSEPASRAACNHPSPRCAVAFAFYRRPVLCARCELPFCAQVVGVGAG